MNYLKTKLALIVCLLLLTSCFSYYKEYGFKSIENKFIWGVVRAKLIGKEKYHTFTAIKSSPYELYISFSSGILREGTIKITELKLINDKDENVVFERNIIIEKSIQKDEYKNDYYTYFLFKDIKLEYVDMILQMKFLLKQGDKTTEYKTEILFEKYYKSFLRIKGV